jgi:hypothetical protein
MTAIRRVVDTDGRVGRVMHMNRYDGSWQWLLALCVIVVPVESALADDAGGEQNGADINEFFDFMRPKVLSPGAPIPANGGILIETISGSTVQASVAAPGGVRIEGTTALLSRSEATYFAWTPTDGIGVGTYRVDLITDGAMFMSAFTIEITEAAERVKPEIAWSPSISALTESSAEVCCEVINLDLSVPCVLSEQRMLAVIDAGLSSTETVATLNQFVYGVRMTGGASAGASFVSFRPFGARALLRVEQAADEYCIQPFALDIVTRQEHGYPELERCVASSSLRFGSVAMDIEDEFFANERCEQPPVGHEERWCEVNAGACEQGVSDRCALFRYACEDGPRPSREVADAGPVEDDAAPVSPSGECSASAPGARGAGSSLVALVLAMAALVRARGLGQ